MALRGPWSCLWAPPLAATEEVRQMAIVSHPQVSAGKATNGHEPADVLVVFGITGDLAKVMTFRSLYRLEQRGLLDCPIVGVAVDDWDVGQLRARARESVGGAG